MKTINNIIFELIQITIGINQRLSYPPSDEEWYKVFTECNRQGVAAIVFPAIEKLANEGLKPPMDLLFRWIGMASQTETVFKFHENATTELAVLLGEGGFTMMVLKGQGMALNYPNPKYRISNDLDIWCFGNEKKVDSFLESKGIEINNSHHHHSVFVYNGITVENHFDFINIYTRPSSKRVELQLKKLASEGYNKQNGLYYPSANFNALFLLRHNAIHFVSSDMKIRHVLDWGVFFKNHHQEINWDAYLKFLNKEGMYRFYNLLGLFCVRNFKMDSLIFKELIEDDLYERFSNDVICPEFKDHENGKLAWSLWVKPRRWWRNRWKSQLCYPDSLTASFIWNFWAKILKPSHFVQ